MNECGERMTRVRTAEADRCAMGRKRRDGKEVWFLSWAKPLPTDGVEGEAF